MNISNKIFNHHKVYCRQRPSLIQRYGKHHYITPEGKEYASITTKLAATKDYTGLNFWKRHVGESVAKYITEMAISTGTKTHKMIECYLNNEPSDEKSLLPKAHFENIKPLLNKINNIQFTEVPLFSDKIQTAGTTDCVAEYAGELSILDWKTSKKKKQNAWIQDYFLQTTAYSQMYEEMSGIKINQGVILITGEDGSVSEYIIHIDDYVDVLHQRLTAYDQRHTITLTNV